MQYNYLIIIEYTSLPFLPLYRLNLPKKIIPFEGPLVILTPTVFNGFLLQELILISFLAYDLSKPHDSLTDSLSALPGAPWERFSPWKLP